MVKYLFWSYIFFFTSCKLVCTEPDLVTIRKDYTGNEIRIDGIYYNKLNNQFFLYRNGVYRAGCYDPKITAIPERFKCSANTIESQKKDRGAWRIFIVKNDTIYLEGWGLVGDCEYNIFSYTGKILNDTTLIIPTDRAGIIRDTFYFSKFPKPDSLNHLIK